MMSESNENVGTSPESGVSGAGSCIVCLPEYTWWSTAGMPSLQVGHLIRRRGSLNYVMVAPFGLHVIVFSVSDNSLGVRRPWFGSPSPPTLVLVPYFFHLLMKYGFNPLAKKKM
jgi:hypothetical protein